MTEEQERVVIRDNRKIDRETAAEAATEETAAVESESPDENAVLLEERTRDLQRVSAEYANYRKRADRDRLAAGDLAIGRVLGELLPVVDDLDRAKTHGDLTGPLKAVADKLDAVFAKLGLVAFGEVGDAFDPALHEAVMHGESDAVTVPTCTTVMRQGYRHGERLLRPAMVGVDDPIPGAGPSLDEAVQDATVGQQRTTNPESNNSNNESQGNKNAEGENDEPPAPPHEEALGTQPHNNSETQPGI